MNAYPASAAYPQQAAALNVAEPWMNLSVPARAIYGTADFINTQADHQRIVGIVRASRPGTATLKLVEGMDHHLDAVGAPQEAFANPLRSDIHEFPSDQSRRLVTGYGATAKSTKPMLPTTKLSMRT
jgi:hypothetical protein